jgi:hypothetical protein
MKPYYLYRRIRLTISLWGPIPIDGGKAWMPLKTAYKIAKQIWS